MVEIEWRSGSFRLSAIFDGKSFFFCNLVVAEPSFSVVNTSCRGRLVKQALNPS